MKRFLVRFTMRSGKVVEILSDPCRDEVTAQTILDDVLKPVDTLKSGWLRGATAAVQIRHVETIEVLVANQPSEEALAATFTPEKPPSGVGGTDAS